jgi:hypothetical protein
MRTIWKFPILSTGPMEMDVPKKARLILVDRDPLTGLIAFWAEVDPDAPKVKMRLQVFGTGHEIPSDGIHRGSVVMGELVWHLFQLTAA